MNRSVFDSFGLKFSIDYASMILSKPADYATRLRLTESNRLDPIAFTIPMDTVCQSGRTRLLGSQLTRHVWVSSIGGSALTGSTMAPRSPFCFG
jgi:hypothetical protein